MEKTIAVLVGTSIGRYAQTIADIVEEIDSENVATRNNLEERNI
ncbi:hypothetical protein Gohar_025266 [Gossypium harknessii]|uniref:Uncharacterized protein n=1 Tax=Gossypium harknessii TaxID=34285 RepID=A0A7J9HII3_9ROSI|nr:hypothetical protein [Gossypium harknessii]